MIGVDATPAWMRSLRLDRWPIAVPALTSALLLWLAYPPVGWWPVAWIAPIGWLRLISRRTLVGRRVYGKLYGVGLLHWLLMIQWIRLPHWSAWLGWWALSLYLAVYVPLFIGMTRVLVHRWNVSSVAAAPITWTGLELLRGHLLTGFSISLLGHSQLPLLPLIQVADLAGAYGVSFLVMGVAAALERSWPESERPRAEVWPPAVAAALVALSWIYGQWRLDHEPLPAHNRQLKVALIQGVYDTRFDGSQQEPLDAFRDYIRLSRAAISQTPDVDLLVWPESMFTADSPMLTYDTPLQGVPEWEGPLDALQRQLDLLADRAREKAAWTAGQLGVPLLVGTGWDHLSQGQVQRFNAAVLVDRQGRMTTRYDKMHPVMFGEYVPLGDWFPWLYRLTPMPAGLTAGKAPQALDVDGVRICPSICFENTVPQLIRRQVRQLNAQGTPPDVLVTITNDGWFWGSSLLDVHLACGVFRAIEMRLPLLIAANTGFSAWIDTSGRLRSRGPRREAGIVVAEILPVARHSPYLAWGDWFAGLCLLAAGLPAVLALRDRRRSGS